jgi:hypothetical protein
MGRTDLYAKIGTGDIIACKRGRKTLVDLDRIDAERPRPEAVEALEGLALIGEHAPTAKAAWRYTEHAH